MNKIKTYSCLLLAVVFTFFASVQYNDPDPYVWIPVYMFVAGLCIIAIFRPINRIILSSIMLIYGAFALYLFPDTYQGVNMPMNERVPAIEEARESLGLLICVVAMVWLVIISSFRNKPATSLQ